MKALYDGLLTKFTASTALATAATGGLWRDQAPEKTAYPFVVASTVSGRTDDAFGYAVEVVTVQFTVYAQGPGDDTADDIAGKLMAAYDWTALTVSGYACIAVRRVSEQSTYDMDENVWAYAIQYEIRLQKTS